MKFFSKSKKENKVLYGSSIFIQMAYQLYGGPLLPTSIWIVDVISILI